MIDVWMNALWGGVVFMTGLLLILLAICGVLVAGWLVQEYLRTRGAEAVDLYTVSLPHVARRNVVSTPLDSTRPRQHPGQAGRSREEEPHVQEELPF